MTSGHRAPPVDEAGGATARPSAVLRWTAAAALLFLLLVLTAQGAAAQDEVVQPIVADTTTQAATPNTTGGEFTPGRGFDLYKSERGTLNISFYGLFRYLNQMPGDQIFLDHLDRPIVVDARHDLNWQRTMVWLTGWFYKPEFRYNITLWSVPATQQTLLFGSLTYRFGSWLSAAVGIAPNRTVRSMQGSWPFWAASDRQMAEEFFRGGFSSGAFVFGEVLPHLYYSASVNTNISQLGVLASNDTRAMAVSGSLEWLPTTGEFGARGGLPDFEQHQEVATRFGVSMGHSRESRYAADSLAPNATQIKLSDGTNPFSAGALVPGVTVDTLDYNEIAVDAGLKYDGFSVQGEYYWRWLSDFIAADVQVPLETIFDQGFMLEAMYMVIPRLVGVYFVSGFVFDDFERNPWELGGGASVWPSRTQSWRINLHMLHIDKSPASSSFGYYTSGQTGMILALGFDILL